MLHQEQRFGNTIQFIRYPPLVKTKGADVALMVQPELAPLMRRVMPDIHVVETAPPEATLHCTLMSLPRAFATDVETIPSAPVWQADNARRAMRRVQLGASDRLRIGFAWRGGADHGNDQNRSLPLSIFLPLIVESVAWFGIQTRMPPTDQDALTIVPELQIFDEKIEDFEDTAALIAALDLIITADTSLAHLAGSMGRECWALLPFNPDWRWLLNRDDSPWHPSVQLFRQPHIGDWASVMAQLRAALQRRFG